jgi:hypothetical protein
VDPSPGLFPQINLTDHYDVADVLQERQVFSEILKEQLAKAQNQMKVHSDSNRTEPSFQVGEYVLLKLQPFSQSSVVTRSFPKLAYKFFGPYEVLEKIGSVAYKLKLPNGSMIHPIFHVSQLKAFTPDHTPVYSTLPHIPQLDIAEVFPKQILNRWLVKKGNEAVTQILVQWSQLPVSSASWEVYYVLQKWFPLAPICQLLMARRRIKWEWLLGRPTVRSRSGEARWPKQRRHYLNASV